MTTQDYIDMGIKDELLPKDCNLENLDSFLSQPLDGLLYDLCLMPEEIGVQEKHKRPLLWMRMVVVVRLLERLNEKK